MWFWHDHFATERREGARPVPDVAAAPAPPPARDRQLRRRCCKAMAEGSGDALYLDGVTNTVARAQRELRPRGDGALHDRSGQLHRAGRGRGVARVHRLGGEHPGPPATRRRSTQRPHRGRRRSSPPRHDAGTKTLLGTTANLDLDGALDVLLNHDATATRIAGKLYTELVGVAPSDKTADAARQGVPRRELRGDAARRGDRRRARPSPPMRAIGSKARSPIEKLVGIVQAIPPAALDVGRLGRRVPHGSASGVGRRAPHARLHPVRAAQRRRVTRTACACSARTNWCTRSTCCRCTRARRRSRRSSTTCSTGSRSSTSATAPARCSTREPDRDAPTRPRRGVARVRGGVTMTDRRAVDLDHELSRRQVPRRTRAWWAPSSRGSYALDTWGRPLAAGRASTATEASRRRSITPWSSSSWPAATTASARWSRTPIRTYRQLRPTLGDRRTPSTSTAPSGCTRTSRSSPTRYRAGQVAIVEGVGYPDNDLSHFASLANWWSAQPGGAGIRRAGSAATSTRPSASTIRSPVS